MAKERLKSPRVRLFVALDLPDPVREELVRWQRRSLVDPALRPIAAQALHVTLCFLGYLPERDLERASLIVGGIEPRAVELRFAEEPVAVPPARPRLFAVDAESAAAEALQSELSARLAAEGLYKPEKRAFWSHVTVARVRPEKGRRRMPRRVEAAPKRLPADLLEPFDAVRVTLYRSILRPQGAEYVPVAQTELPARAAER